MDWIQFSIFMFTVGGLFWSQKTDINTNRTEAAADRRDMLQLLREMQQEMKDFHGRLCKIEENRK